MSGRKRIPLAVIVLFAIDSVLAISYVVIWLVQGPSGRLFHLLDLDGESNVPTWYSSVQLFCVSVLLGLFAVRNFDRPRKATWALMLCPLFFLALSADEIATVHEKVAYMIDGLFLPGGDRKATSFRETGIWVFVLGIPVFSACLLALRSLRKYFASPPHLYKKISLGLFIYFGGAIGIETLSNMVDANTLGYMIETSFEELFEMVGVTVLLWAALDLLSAYGFALHLDPVEGRTGKPGGLFR